MRRMHHGADKLTHSVVCWLASISQKMGNKPLMRVKNGDANVLENVLPPTVKSIQPFYGLLPSGKVVDWRTAPPINR